MSGRENDESGFIGLHFEQQASVCYVVSVDEPMHTHWCRSHHTQARNGHSGEAVNNPQGRVHIQTFGNIMRIQIPSEDLTMLKPIYLQKPVAMSWRSSQLSSLPMIGTITHMLHAVSLIKVIPLCDDK
jgi:hypothetical protein